MKDILITKNGKNAEVKPQTEAAKKVFNESQYPNGLVVPTKALKDILSWAISHNLSIDSQLPIRIPSLLAPYEPKFAVGEDWSKIDEMIAATEKNLEHLQAIDSFAKKKRQLLYRYFYCCVGDGRCYYQITKVTKTTATVTLCAGIDLDNWVDQILGEESTLPLAKAEQLVNSRQALEDLFSKKQGS